MRCRSFVWVCVVVLMIATGCGWSTDAAPSGTTGAPSPDMSGQPSSSSPPAPENGAGNDASTPGNESAQGPFTWLLSGTPEEIQTRLGVPARIDPASDKRMETWVYPDKGLRVVVWKSSGVFWFVQTKGQITENVSIGDSEQQVTDRFGPASTLPTGERVLRVDEKEFSVEFTFKDGRVVSAQILPPDSDM